ncbi:hypothetical protein [Mesorhizobium sp.]|uniref:hypothetical protein n=1 Tax=Mesorhizobium sp. TaxID=1871066 RepID=UPI0025FB8DD7|nr:hypothetical protein [Mesorhizobium sp.]
MARPATAAVRLLTGEREPVRLATTANLETIVIDGVARIQGLKMLDGAQTATGDRVLVKDQADARLNGIYTASEGYWYRAADARTGRTMQKGTTVHVQEGTVLADFVFAFQTLNPVIGTDDIVLSFYQSDDTVGDIQAAAQGIIDQAQAAADVATGAMTTVLDPQFATKATAEAYSPAVAPDYIRTAGYSQVGDGQALYRKNGTILAGGGGLAITLQGGAKAGFDIINAPRSKEINIRAAGADTAAGNNRTAIVNAIAAAGQGRLIIPAGTFSLAGNIDIPQGLTVEFDDRALLQRTEDAMHLFNLKGDNRIIAPKVNGAWNHVAAANGFGVFNISGISGVTIEHGTLTGTQGDHYRIADSSWVYIDDARGDTARNIVTINDEVSGTSHVFVRRARVSAYLNGFDAESDDDWPVSDIEVDVDWTQLGGVQLGAAVAFTRSAAPAGSVLKYKRLRISAKSRDGLYGLVLRGAKDIEVRSLVTEGVQQGIRAGTGHHIEDLRLLSFDIQATHQGIYIETPAGQQISRGVRIGAGRIFGFTQANAYGVFSAADETIVSADTLVDMGGAAASIGVRLNGDMSQTHASIADARSSYVALSTLSSERQRATGGLFKATTGSVVNDMKISGSSPNVEVRNNIYSGTATGKPTDDGSHMALIEGNRCGDLFKGYKSTADATPVLMVFEAGNSFVPIRPGQGAKFTADVAARRTDGSASTSAGYVFAGVVRNTGGTLAVEGAITKTVIGEYATDAASLDASVAVGASGIEVTVTGVAAKTYGWNAVVRLQEV